MTVICVCISSLRPLWIRLRGGCSSSGGRDETNPRSKSRPSYGLEYLPSDTHRSMWEVSHDGGLDNADAESSKGGSIRGTVIPHIQKFSLAYEVAESSASTENDVEAQVTIEPII